ncbi:MAG: GNAT family N-acetyltransferase [Anaerolineae bacterium]|nr:GNAT family N-acetyltransferase [Anaerolineae bacterium]
MPDFTLQIRAIQPDDIPGLHAIISHPQVAENGLHLYTTEFSDTQEQFQKSKPGVHRLVGELDGQVVVHGQLRQYQRARLTHTGELGIYVHPDFWGQGIGTQMMEKLLDIADNWLPIWRLNLETFSHNKAARRLAEKFGFKREGVQRKAAFGNGRFQDITIYARLKPPNLDVPRIQLDPPPLMPALNLLTEKPAITIRPAHPDDASDLSTLWQHPLVCATTLQMPSQEIWQTKQRMDGPPPAGLHRLVADDNGRCVGMITVNQRQNPRQTHCGGIGMMVHRNYWGWGIGTQLMAAILDITDNWLGLTRVELEVNTDNPAAIRLYQKFGFEIEGTHKLHALGNGRWADSYFMARLR